MHGCEHKATWPRSVTVHGTLMYAIANSGFWVPFARAGLQIAGSLENTEYTCRVIEQLAANQLKAQQNLINSRPCIAAPAIRST